MLGAAARKASAVQARHRRDHHARVALVDEAGATAGDVDHFADQVGVDLLHEVFEVQVEVVDAAAQLGGVVVAQVFRRR
jgi:hypothetical protein